MRDFLPVWLLLTLLCITGCDGCRAGEAPVSTTGSGGSGGSGGEGTGGGDPSPCGVDCSQFPTPPCLTAVCNTGQEVGPLNTCVVVAKANGTQCDDGVFCTSGDVCDGGTCVGGSPNECGNPSSPCTAVICYEDSKSCDISPVNDGADCTPTDLCQVSGVCHIGECMGVEPKDCTFSPLNECNTVACDPATGKCKGTPDADKDNAPCVLTGPLCSTNKTCTAGQCGGGTAKDCSAFDVGCELGMCDPSNGFCGPVPAPVGTTCDEGIPACYVGACDDKGTCLPFAGPNGVACNDHNACTKTDTCTAGTCAGLPLAGCVLYLNVGYEACPSGWTLGGDWQCGAPSNVGPPSAHTGNGVIATQIAGVYHVNQSFSTAVADSPSINLTQATKPMVSFWAWDHTEGGTFDGWNLKISTDGGQNFAEVTTVTPAYNLSLLGQAAWGGNHSTEGWQNYTADLTAYVGQQVILRIAFRSDGASVYPGVYIDDLVVAEPLQIPLYITTTSPLTDVYAGMDFSATIARIGGTSGALWSKVGGPNWLTIDDVTGVLKGTAPPVAGPVSVTVRIEEPTFPTNFAEKTFTFNVKKVAYYTSFEGACPSDWTLTGDWQCGVPTNVGPATAYVGTQCLGTQIAGTYNDGETYAGTTATSPDIDLTGAPSLILTWRMWIDTEGSTYDGANLKISTDGGMNYSTVNNAMPSYPLVVAGEPAWGGHQELLGWQLGQVDLSAYAGQIIRLRFSFRSDSSATFAGVYIDDLFVD